MVQQPLPNDIYLLRPLLQASQAALDACTRRWFRTQVAKDAVQNYLATPNCHEHYLQQYTEIDLADVRAYSSELSDCSTLAKYLDREEWVKAWSEWREACELLGNAEADELCKPESALAVADILLAAHEKAAKSAEAVVGIFRALRDRILESLQQAASLKPEKPSWNGETLQLKFRDKCVRRLRPDAEKMRVVLQCFEDANWPEHVQLPSTWDDQTVRETVKTLNKELSSLRFRSANRRGVGNIMLPGVEWILVSPRATPAQAP
jgi:hypothetical protein